MNLLSSLDAKDRRLLRWALGIGVALAVLSGVLFSDRHDNDNPVPSSYLAGQHGARAAYETLLRAGYPLERWERPLSELAANAGPDTVVIFAEPFSREASDIRAVRQIVERGGRVLATGFWGGVVLPAGASDTPREFSFAACQLEPEGLDPLAGSGEVWMMPEATWQVGNPAQRIQYSCGGQPAVVEYDWGKGHIVWWASSTPLENGSIARAQNLELLLNSLGPRQGRRFFWDESLHGNVRSGWSYAGGPSFTLLCFGLPVLGLLIVFSFSRRSGPVRDLPPPPRASPIEFLDALGSLYRNAGAASTALEIAWERFARQSLYPCGLPSRKMSAAELASILRRRFPAADRSLEADLAACEEADETIAPREVLKLIQALHRHQKQLAATIGAGSQWKIHPSRKRERAS